MSVARRSKMNVLLFIGVLILAVPLILYASPIIIYLLPFVLIGLGAEPVRRSHPASGEEGPALTGGQMNLTALD